MIFQGLYIFFDKEQKNFFKFRYCIANRIAMQYFWVQLYIVSFEKYKIRAYNYDKSINGQRVEKYENG